MPSPPNLKIAYLCDISPVHKQPYSGGNARIFQALKDQNCDVDILPNTWGLVEPIRQMIYNLPEGTNLRLRWRLHLLMAKIIARSVHNELAKRPYDVLFGAYSFQSMSQIKPPPHILTAYTADATPTVYKRSEIGRSFGSSKLATHVLDPLTLRAERDIFRSIDLLLWPSEWLKSGADALYDLHPNQSMVIPWGANIDPLPAPQGTPEFNSSAPIHLLVVARDWWAKGGPIAFDTMMDLRARGLDVRLTVIGTTPPAHHTNEYVTSLGPLDKSNPGEMAKFTAAFQRSHFLVMPSFESWGFAFCEAAAYGLPSLCLRMGGVPVRNNINGFALEVGVESGNFANIIMALSQSPARYAKLRETTRNEYETTLNWDVWAKSAVEKMRGSLTMRLSQIAPHSRLDTRV